MRQHLVGFGDEQEWRAFVEGHPLFLSKLENLLALLDRTLIRASQTDSPADRVVFFLGRLALEDFMEVLLLCGNGYGIAGLKLLRGLYERAVTARYLSRNPNEAETFFAYHAIQEWKTYQRAKEVYGYRHPVSAQRAAEMEAAYQATKEKFEEPLCRKCDTKRLQFSWSKLDTASMALKAGGGLQRLYLSCYLLPTLNAHATVTSLMLRLAESPEGGLSFKEGAQRDWADAALSGAHAVIIQVIDTQNQHFHLGLEAELSQCCSDYNEIWKTETPALPQPPEP